MRYLCIKDNEIIESYDELEKAIKFAKDNKLNIIYGYGLLTGITEDTKFVLF